MIYRNGHTLTNLPFCTVCLAMGQLNKINGQSNKFSTQLKSVDESPKDGGEKTNERGNWNGEILNRAKL